MKAFEVTINDIDLPMKVRDYMKKHLGFSTSLIAKVKYDGVYINGNAVHMRAILSYGDKLRIIYPDEDSENIKPIDIPLDIIYEDQYLIAVNKPINMPVHPSRGNSLPTLANAVRAYINAPFVFRAVNRLDRDTSGLVLIAKDPLTAALMCRAIKSGGLRKKYTALVSGIPDPAEAEINAPIARQCEGDIKRTVRQDGKESITKYRVVRQNSLGDSVCEVEPITGRTHQIRVHMAYIGHPLKNDFLYGERSENGTYSLHCKELVFRHPYTENELTVTAPEPF